MAKLKILYSHDYPDDTTMEISVREDGNTQLELSFTSEDPDYGTETMVYAGDTNDWRKLAGELKKEITEYLDSSAYDDYYDEYSRTALYAFENMLNELGFRGGMSIDIINDGLLWGHMIKSIAEKCGKHTFSGVHFDTDGDSILCDSPAAAEIIADFLEMIGYDVATTGSYEEEDGKTWYYIDVE